MTWFEIEGEDAKKLQDFYAKAFDWKIDADNPMNYGMVEATDKGIPGGPTLAHFTDPEGNFIGLLKAP